MKRLSTVEALPVVSEAVTSLPRIVTAADLYAGNVVRLRPLFKDLLWDGLTMLIARPKAGKSWLTLQAAIHVAGGPRIPGVNSTETGTVLYIALEEPESRTMARLRQITMPGPWATNIHFVYELLPLNGGGLEQLHALIGFLKPRLVVIDTLTALIKGGGKRDSDVFRGQYAEVSSVRKLAEEFKTAILLVHHVRKGAADSAIEAVAGTGGIAAAVDTIWQLKRKPEGEATLEVLGREVEEKTLAMRFDEEPFGWRILGDNSTLLVSGERREILDLLRDDGAMTPAAIAAELGRSRVSVRQMLKRMRGDDQVRKEGLKYSVVPLSISHGVTERERERE